MYKEVDKGISFSKSIYISMAGFDKSILSMISYGELSGVLAFSIKQTVEIISKKDEIKKKIISSLIYPLFIAIATIGMTLFLVLYIFPKIIPLLSSMNVKLPLLTLAIKRLYELLYSYGIYISISMIFIIGIFLFLYKKIRSIRILIHSLLLKIPILGEFLKKYSVGSYFQLFSMLFENGQSTQNIITQSYSSAIFEPYKRVWSNSIEFIDKGIPLSEFMSKNRIVFPSMVIDMVSIGEKTGTIGLMFGNISRAYNEEIDLFIKRFSSLIEPALMILMGIMVGSVALSIILPIYELTNHLSA